MSEYIGDSLESLILSPPGYWAVETVMDDGDDDEVIGWVLFHRDE